MVQEIDKSGAGNMCSVFYEHFGEKKIFCCLSYGIYCIAIKQNTQWKSCNKMETLFTLLALCVGNSPITSEFPHKGPVMWSFDELCMVKLSKLVNKELSSHPFETTWWCWWDITVMKIELSLSWVICSQFSLLCPFVYILHCPSVKSNTHLMWMFCTDLM